MKTIFSIRLNALRCENNLTLQDVADYLSVNKATISYYEQGKRVPSFNKLVKLGELFNVSLDYLLGHDYNLKEENSNYLTRDLVLKSIYRSKVLRNFLLENPNNIEELEKYIKSLNS